MTSPRRGYLDFAVDDAIVEEAVSSLVTLVDIDATSGAERAIADGFARLGDALQLRVERVPVAPGRDNILLGDARPRIVMCTHMDTVPPHFGATRVDDIVYGRGAADAKGVAVAMAYALRLLTDAGCGDGVACWFVVGEETDHSGARALLDRPRPATIILGEPCGGLPVRGQKGLLKLELSATGTAAHSAYPELGASATHALVRALAALVDAELPEDRAALGRTTVNVGTIRGGVAANVVAPSATAEVLIRCAAPVDAILEAVRSTVDNAVGPVISMRELSRAEPLEFLADPDQLGTEGSGDPVPFNTDAHTLRPLGATMLLMGPGDMRTCHGPDEHLPVDALQQAITDYAALVLRLR